MFKQISSKAAGYRFPGAGETGWSNKLSARPQTRNAPEA